MEEPPASTGLIVSPSNATLTVGAVLALDAFAQRSEGASVLVTAEATWRIDDARVATVQAGILTAVAPGETTLRASYGGTEASVPVRVTAAVTMVQIQVAPAPIQLALGTRRTLAATAIYSDSSQKDVSGQAQWSTGDNAVALVQAGPVSGSDIVAAGIGVTVVTASLSGVSGRAAVEVTAATLTSISVTPSNPSTAKGMALPFTATGIFSDGSHQDLTAQVSWSASSAAAVFSETPGEEGHASALTEGVTTVTASLGNVTGSTALTVTAARLLSIGVAPPSASLALGRRLTLSATGVFSDGTTQDLTEEVVWRASSTALSFADGSPRGEVEATGVGTATVSAMLAGVTGSATLTVTRAELVSLAVSPHSISLALGTVRHLTAVGTYTDASTQDLTQEVTWLSTASAVTVSNEGTSRGLATAAAVGSSTVSATLGDVMGTATVTITRARLSTLSVAPPNASVPRGMTQQLSATGYFDDGSVQDLTTQATWMSSGPEADVSNADGSRGLARGIQEGTVTVTASFDGVSGSAPLVVTAARLVSISVTAPQASLAKGLTLQFSATGTYSDDSTRDLTADSTWETTGGVSVSNASSSQGLVTALAEGSATVSASFSGIGGSRALEVTAATLVSLQVSPPNLSIARGLVQQMSATGIFTDHSTQNLTAQVSWSTSSTAASVSNADGSRGVLTALAAGTAQVSATMMGASGTASVTVSAATVSALEVEPVDPKLAQGTSVRLSATALLTDGSIQDVTEQVSWTTSSASVAAVSNGSGSQGTVTGVAPGVAQVTASLTVGGSTWTDPVAVTVTSATLSAINVTPAGAVLAPGTSRAFTATGTLSDGSTQDLTSQASWSSSDPGVATASNTSSEVGLVRAVASGIARVNASFGGVTGGTTLTVTSALLSSVTVTSPSETLPLGFTVQLTATGLFSDGSTQDVTPSVLWSSSDTGVATVSNSSGSQGRVAATALGTTTLSATIAGYQGVFELTVTNATLSGISVSPSALTLAVGGKQGLVATGTFSDGSTLPITTQVRWSSSAKRTASVSAGVVTGLRRGAASITASKGNRTAGSAAVTVQ